MSDPRPFRLRVLDAVTETLESISVANGYSCELAGAVFRGRDMFGNDDPLPMTAILEPPVAPDALFQGVASGSTYSEWELLLQGFVDSDTLSPKHPTDPGHFLLADLKKALVKEKRRDEGFNAFGMQGRVEVHAIGQGVVRPADEVSAHAYVLLPIVLRIAENHEDPFA